MSSPSTAKPGLYYGWYIVATAIFIAFATTGARNAFGIFDKVGGQKVILVSMVRS